MIVKKFGGSSLAKSDIIKKVGEIILAEEKKCLVVVSASGKTTNRLVSMIENLENSDIIFAQNDLKIIKEHHSQLIKELGLGTKATDKLQQQLFILSNIIESVKNRIDLNEMQKDVILSSGEIICSYFLMSFLNTVGVRAEFIDSRKVIKTDSNFTNAEVDLGICYQNFSNNIQPLFNHNEVVVMGGFIGSDQKNRTTTIGRGGSDYTASIAASGLGAELLEIWTDVDGIMTIDPKFNNDAKRILRLSYDEAAELAYFGAKVLHPKTIGPAIRKNIPVVVKNTYNPDFVGTTIGDDEEKPKIIKAISYWDNITVINIKSNRMLGAFGFLSKVFEVFKKHETSVDLIATSEVSLSLTIDDSNKLNLIKKELEEFAIVNIDPNHSIISTIGEGIKQTSGIAKRLFGILEEVNIKMISVGASEVNISMVVHQSDLEKSLNLLHNEFFSRDLDKSIFN